MTKKFPTLAACDIVGLDRQRFNEDLAAGIYSCAPELHTKTGRWFDEDDLCALFVYAFFLRQFGADGGDALHRKPNMSKRVSARYASGVWQALKSDLDGATRIDFPLSGFNDDWEAMAADQPPAFFVTKAPRGVRAVGSRVATVCFHLDGIRQEVRDRVAAWAGERV